MTGTGAEDPEERFQADLRPTLASLLAVVGPVSIDRVHRVLARAGVFAPLMAEGFDETDQRWSIEAVAEDDRTFVRTNDDLIAHLPTLLDGVTLTHHITADERRRHMLDAGVDLGVLSRRRHRLRLVGGGEAVFRHSWSHAPQVPESLAALGILTDPAADRHGSWVGPPGWLDHLPTNGWVAVRHDGGLLALAPCPLGAALAVHEGLLRAFDAAARRLDELDGDLEGQPEDLVLDVLVHDPDLLRAPGPPISIVFERLGLTWDGDCLFRTTDPRNSGRPLGQA